MTRTRETVSGNIRRRFGRTALAAGAALVTCALPAADARADDTAARSAEPQAVAAAAETIRVKVGQSTVVDTPWPVTRVSITQTDTADVQVLSPDQVLVQGKELGTTDLILWSEDGDIWHRQLAVVIDLGYVQAELRKIFPGCELEVFQSQDVLVVSGSLRRADQVELLRRTLESFGIKYIDKTSVAGVQQVMIKIRVAEVSREAIRSLGVNAFYGGDEFVGASLIGPDGGGALNPISVGQPAGASALGNLPFAFLADSAISTGITLFGAFPGSDLSLFIQALAENQYLRILAEPTLIALSGEEANFLAGGEFPVPVVQGSTAGAGSTITIEYKEFGIRLNFLPHVLGENRIRLYVAPEVSDLSDVGAVEIEGFRIPSVLTRRAQTTLELRSGQTFAMAGLLSQFTNARNSKVPLLGDLPILGSLFRSVRYTQGETELVVLATASLIEPSVVSEDYPAPGSFHVTPDDWELYMDGRLDGMTPDRMTPADAAWLREKGLDRLQGPGAWATYDQAPAGRESGSNDGAARTGE